ncbi:MAG: hypothetical protein ACLFNU_04005 [Bacteroidales bacterium]
MALFLLVILRLAFLISQPFQALRRKC